MQCTVVYGCFFRTSLLSAGATGTCRTHLKSDTGVVVGVLWRSQEKRSTEMQSKTPTPAAAAAVAAATTTTTKDLRWSLPLFLEPSRSRPSPPSFAAGPPVPFFCRSSCASLFSRARRSCGSARAPAGPEGDNRRKQTDFSAVCPSMQRPMLKVQYEVCL